MQSSAAFVSSRRRLSRKAMETPRVIVGHALWRVFAKATKPKGNGDRNGPIGALRRRAFCSRRRLSRKAMETADRSLRWKQPSLSFAKATKPKGNGDRPASWMWCPESTYRSRRRLSRKAMETPLAAHGSLPSETGLFAKATKPKGNGDWRLMEVLPWKQAGSRRRLSRKAMETRHPFPKEPVFRRFAKATKPKGNGDTAFQRQTRPLSLCSRRRLSRKAMETNGTSFPSASSLPCSRRRLSRKAMETLQWKICVRQTDVIVREGD